MPEQLVAFAASCGMPAVALTDLNGLYAAVRLQQACQKAGVKPIFGAEPTLADGLSVMLLARNLGGPSFPKERVGDSPTFSRNPKGSAQVCYYP